VASPQSFVAGAWEGAVVALVGAPRSGKSRLAKACDAAGAWSRRLVYEPHAARDRIESRRGRLLYPWPGRLVSVSALLRCPELLDREPLRLVVAPDPCDGSERALGAQFAAVARAAWHTGGITIVAEEAALYARHTLGLANLIATGGGHAGMRLLVISQSWTRIPIDVRRCVSHVVAFAQSEPADVSELRKKCGPGFARGVARLALGAPPLTWRLGDALT
jgi:hypothetical protein